MDEVVRKNVVRRWLPVGMARRAGPLKDALTLSNERFVHECFTPRCVLEERNSGRVDEGTENTNRCLSPLEIGAVPTALLHIDGGLSTSGPIVEVAEHALGRAHSDVEVDAKCSALAARIILAALSCAMNPHGLTAYGHIEERPVGQIKHLSDNPGVVDVVAFKRSGVHRSRCPALEYLLARIVRRKIRPEESTNLNELIASRGMDVLPARVVRVLRWVCWIQSCVTGGAAESVERH